MTDQELATLLGELISLGHETTGVECKPAGPLSDDGLFGRVMKAVLGMANRRDGGMVVIGIDDTGSSLQPHGLTTGDQSTWTYDEVSDRLKEYAEPSISFELSVRDYTGRKLVVLDVREFEQVPILCRKPLTVAGRVVLREGVCYVRSRRKPETAEVSRYEDMRELLDLATEKSLRKYVETAWHVGVALVPPGLTIQPPSPSDAKGYERELGDLR